MNLNSLDLNLLVALDALLREASVSRAAMRIGLSQPAASHALQRLREVLGDPLLVRVGARMESTPRAQALRGPLAQWCDAAPSPEDARLRRRRVDVLFPSDFDDWNEERVLDRYELLYSARLIEEAQRKTPGAALPASGEPMASDHRRILATALSRLRGKLKYRPIIFELTPPRFTLLELQKSLEALTGLRLHKQNFRRGLERTGFVAPTGQMHEDTGGRPAELYAYDRDRFRFSPSSGLSLPRA